MTRTDPRPAVGRRAALKARHRQAILDAADALIRERGSRQFGVDELAERADVARRTVFNHFGSLDDVVASACTRVVTAAVTELRQATAAEPAVDDSCAALFDEVASALRGVDFPTVIAYLWGVLDDDAGDTRAHLTVQDVFHRTSEELAVETAARAPEEEALEVQIMVTSLLSGLAVVAGRWVELTGGALDPASRAAWRDLLDRLVRTVGRGYDTGETHDPDETDPSLPHQNPHRK